MEKLTPFPPHRSRLNKVATYPLPLLFPDPFHPTNKQTNKQTSKKPTPNNKDAGSDAEDMIKNHYDNGDLDNDDDGDNDDDDDDR